VAKPVAALIGGTARLLGKDSEMGAGTVDMLDRKNTYSIERARKLLGYNPGTSLEEGMRRTEEWARAEGLL
jgi:nucleoside-diphosphate-sugar epimerase